MDKLQKILREYLNKGSERIDVTMVLALIQQCKKDTKEQLTLTDVSSMFSAKQMEQAFNDGIEAEQQRCCEFDIENYC